MLCKLEDIDIFNNNVTNEIFSKMEAEAVANKNKETKSRLKTIQKYMKIIKDAQKKTKDDSLVSSTSTYSKQQKAIEHSRRKKWAIIVGVLVVFSLLGLYLFAIIPIFTLRNNKRDIL